MRKKKVICPLRNIVQSRIKQNYEGGKKAIALMARTSVSLWIGVFFPPLWIIFNVFTPAIYVSTSVLCISERCTRPNPSPSPLVFSPCSESLALLCFPEVKAAGLEFQIFPPQKLFYFFYFFCVSPSAGRNLLRAPTPRSSICHPSTYWNVTVALPAAWMRPTGAFLGLQ